MRAVDLIDGLTYDAGVFCAGRDEADKAVVTMMLNSLAGRMGVNLGFMSKDLDRHLGSSDPIPPRLDDGGPTVDLLLKDWSDSKELQASIRRNTSLHRSKTWGLARIERVSKEYLGQVMSRNEWPETPATRLFMKACKLQEMEF